MYRAGPPIWPLNLAQAKTWDLRVGYPAAVRAAAFHAECRGD